MRKRLFGFVVVALVLVCTESWAPTSGSAVPTPASPEIGVCGEPASPCITHVFTVGDDSFLYDFTAVDGSSIRVTFVGGVRRTFSLTVDDVRLTDAQLAARLDPRVFPDTSCFHYFDNMCHEYAFSGNAGGANGTPVIGDDYGPPIHLRLTYFTPDEAFDPAFGHAPEESRIFRRDILIDYFREVRSDDTMDGSTPTMSSVIALNRRLEENDKFCWVSPQDFQPFKVGDDVEVAFRLFASGPCTGNPGRPLRDRDARLSLAKFVNGEFVFQHIRTKHFRFERGEGVNEAEIETEGLTPGTYFITVRSDEFSPETRRIVLVP